MQWSTPITLEDKHLQIVGYRHRTEYIIDYTGYPDEIPEPRRSPAEVLMDGLIPQTKDSTVISRAGLILEAPLSSHFIFSHIEINMLTSNLTFLYAKSFCHLNTVLVKGLVGSNSRRRNQTDRLSNWAACIYGRHQNPLQSHQPHRGGVILSPLWAL